MNILQYFDRIAIIHLPERLDRLREISSELNRMGIHAADEKVFFPYAPRPDNPNGFPSKAIYGNFLSHLSILKAAQADNLKNILVLEDDAMFSRSMINGQAALTEQLERAEWDLCFFGHSLTSELSGQPRGLIPHRAEFMWAHCYAVNARVLPKLIAYLEKTIDAPAGDPQGGKLYIDAAFTLFRRFHPEVITLVGNPMLCRQRGSDSSIACGRWYRSIRALAPAVSLIRSLKDSCWRLTT